MLINDYKTIEKTGLDIGSSYYYFLSLAYYNLGQYDKAIEYLESFNTLFDQIVKDKSDNEFHHWVVTGKRMAGKSLLALTHAKSGTRKKSLDLIGSIMEEIPTQPRLFYENSVEILYNIGESYRILDESEKSKTYIKRAAEEMNRISSMLTNDDRSLFLNNILIHKKIQGTTS